MNLVYEIGGFTMRENLDRFDQNIQERINRLRKVNI